MVSSREEPASRRALATALVSGWEFGADDSRMSAYDLRIQKPFDDLAEVEDVVAQAVRLHDERAGGMT